MKPKYVKLSHGRGCDKAHGILRPRSKQEKKNLGWTPFAVPIVTHTPWSHTHTQETEGQYEYAGLRSFATLLIVPLVSLLMAALHESAHLCLSNSAPHLPAELADEWSLSLHSPPPLPSSSLSLARSLAQSTFFALRASELGVAALSPAPDPHPLP